MGFSFNATDWGSCVDSHGVATLQCIPVIVKNFTNFLIIFAGIVAVFMVMYGGFKFLTSQGDPAKLDSARKTLIYSVIGLLLIIFSYYIVALIGNLTGVKQLPH